MAHTSKKRLTNIAEEIIVCHKCKLHKTRKNAVPGEGNIDSRIMFIGEAPGYSHIIAKTHMHFNSPHLVSL